MLHKKLLLLFCDHCKGFIDPDLHEFVTVGNEHYHREDDEDCFSKKEL